jgi:flagellar biosynthetic protein FliO
MNAWAAGASATPPELWGPLLKGAGMFCVVLGLLLVTLFVLKRFLMERRGTRQQEFFKLVTSYSVAPKSRLMVVDVKGNLLLLGVTPHHINYLARLDNAEAAQGPSSCDSRAENEAGFRKILGKAIGIGNNPR